MFFWKSLWQQAEFLLHDKKPVKHYFAGADSREWGLAGLQLASAHLQVHPGF